MMDTPEDPVVTTSVSQRRGSNSLIATTMQFYYRETKEELMMKALQMESLSESARKRLQNETFTTKKQVTMSEAAQWKQAEQQKGEIGQGGVLKNGWQMVRNSMQERVGWLFNSWTMCDIVFVVGDKEIPCHKFVLGVSSPVLYTNLFEQKDDDPLRKHRRTTMRKSQCGKMSDVSEMLSVGNTPSANCKAERVELEGCDPDVFFEFIRFVYTDSCTITLDTVTEFLGLSDEFLVPGLTSKCVEFLKEAIVASDALKVLCIIEKILCKICFWFWRLDAQAARERGGDHESSRAPSALSQYLGAPTRDRFSLCSTDGQRGSLGALLSHHATSHLELTRTLKNKALAFYLARAIQDLQQDCLDCISTNTGEVLASPGFSDSSIRHVRMILEMPHLTVPEISVFRAVRHWLSVQPPGALDAAQTGVRMIHGQKEDAKDSLLSLIRFPTMTVEQIQWEVVPSQLLSYEDVHQLLRFKTNQHKHSANPAVAPSLVRFNPEPREGYSGEDMPPLETGDPKPEMDKLRTALPEYKAKEGDIIDQQLAAQLRFARLRHCSDRHVQMLSPQPQSPCCFPMRDHGRIQEPAPQDFEYIKPGSYVYQGEKHIRMWLEDGDIMVREASRPPTRDVTKSPSVMGYDQSKTKRPGMRARGESEGPRSARLANVGKSLAMTGESLSCFI